MDADVEAGGIASTVFWIKPTENPIHMWTELDVNPVPKRGKAREKNHADLTPWGIM